MSHALDACRVGIVLLTAFLASPVVVHADNAGMVKQYDSAIATLLAGMSARDFSERYKDNVVDGIAGNWVSISLMTEVTGGAFDADDAAKACDARFTLAVRESFEGFAMVEGQGDDEVSYSFVSVGGATFIQTVDPERLAQARGLDPGKPDSFFPESTKHRLMREVIFSENGLVMVFRPSPDILAILGPSIGSIDVFGRCS